MAFLSTAPLFALYIDLIYNIIMRQKTERKQHLFGIPLPIWERLEVIKKHLGVASTNDALQYCINQTYKEFNVNNKN